MLSPRYIVTRAMQTVFMIMVVITLLFLLFRFMPGDFADVMLAEGASAETVELFREEWGLDEPLYVQYYTYLINILTLNAGTSFQTRVPVWEMVKMRIFNTIILVAPAVTLGYIVGSLFGAYIGINRGTLREKVGAIASIISGSFPEFFTSILLVIFFSAWLGWFPSSGLISTSTAIELSRADAAWYERYFTTDFLWHYTLPFVAVFFRFFFLPVLTMRTSVVEVSGQDFIYYHRITGLPYFDRLRRIMIHASLPVITLYPLSMLRAISGLVLIELVFAWPGIGYTLVQAVFNRDYPVLQFVFIVAATFVILANFAVDILYGVIDPGIGEDS